MEQGKRGGPGTPPPREPMGRGYRGRGGGGCSSSLMLSFIIILVIILLFAGAAVKNISGDDDSSNTEEYGTSFERLDSGTDYDTDCITDELGWIDDVEWLCEDLEYFYELTGIQPYIYMAAYRDEFATEDGMNEFAEDLYDEITDDEYTFLFVCFADEAEEDIDYMCYVSGAEASEIINEDTIDIFWDALDYYWSDDTDIDVWFALAFESAADDLME